jgi:integrase
MRKACEAANIAPVINFHVPRHTYATRALRNGTSMPEIGFLIGHKPGSPTMAKHYDIVMDSDITRSSGVPWVT